MISNADKTMKETRLNKAIASIGLCSRRKADELIASSEVTLNGKLVTEIGTKVKDGDEITVSQRLYIFKSQQKTKLWIYYKPRGLVTTHKDEQNRNTVFEDLKLKIKERVISVGRLDLNSEGLLLITNNGEFSRYAESPQTGWERHYKVRIFGKLTNEIIKKIEKGVAIERVSFAPMKIKSIGQISGSNRWVECILTEGKNREIRKIFQKFGIAVNRLIRIKYGPYKLGNLKPGELIETKAKY